MKGRSLLLRGVFYYEADRAFEAGRLVEGAGLKLAWEPGNPHDANAVVVSLGGTYEKLGYLSQKVAQRYRIALQERRVNSAKVHEVGWYKDRKGRSTLKVVVRIAVSRRGPREGDKPQTVSGTSSIADSLPLAGGVYSLTNGRQGRTYIGSTSNIRGRIRQHLRDLSLGVHSNPYLQEDFNRQSGQGFVAHVEELISSASAREEAEKATIAAALRHGRKLYNMTRDGQGRANAGASDGEPPPPISDWQRPRRWRRSVKPVSGFASGIEATTPPSSGDGRYRIPGFISPATKSQVRDPAPVSPAKPRWGLAAIYLLVIMAVALLIHHRW